MHGDVGAVFRHRELQLLDEQSFAADLGERAVEDAITLRRHRHQHHGQVRVRLSQLRGDVLGLPQSQSTLARRDAQRAGRSAHRCFTPQAA